MPPYSWIIRNTIGALITFIVILLAYKSTRHGSKGFKLIIGSGVLYFLFAIQSTIRINFPGPYGILVSSLLGGLPCILVSIGLMYFYKDLVQESKEDALLYILLYEITLISLFLLISSYISGLSRIKTFLSYTAAPLMILPSVLWVYKLWKETKKPYWLFFLGGYVLHALSLLLVFYRKNLCGVGGRFRGVELCSGFEILAVPFPKSPAVFNLPLLPFSKILFKISTLPLFQAAMILYMASFLSLILSIKIGGSFKRVTKIEPNLANKQVNRSVKEVGKIIGSPLAHRIASQALETEFFDLEDKIEVGKDKINIEAHGNSLLTLSRFLYNFTEKTSDLIGPAPGRVVVKDLRKASKENSKFEKAYFYVLANKKANEVVRSLGKITKTSLAYNLASRAVKGSRIEGQVKIRKESMRIENYGRGLETLIMFIDLYLRETEKVTGPVAKRMIKKTLKKDIEEHPVIKRIIDKIE